MLTHEKKQRLINNWGERADSLECMAEVRVFDPLSSWECFIYALNPDDENQISCIINGFEVEITIWSLSELAMCFNSHGEAPQIDKEYRPRQTAILYKILKERKGK